MNIETESVKDIKLSEALTTARGVRITLKQHKFFGSSFLFSLAMKL